MGSQKLDEKYKEVKNNDNKVFVANHRSGGKRKYHQDEDCEYITENHEVWEIDLVEAWEIDACKSCTNTKIR